MEGTDAMYFSYTEGKRRFEAENLGFRAVSDGSKALPAFPAREEAAEAKGFTLCVIHGRSTTVSAFLRHQRMESGSLAGD